MSIQTMPAMEAQPNFPNEDLSEVNARILPVVLASSLQLEFGHAGAEQLVWTYRAGHPAMRRAIDRVPVSTSVQEAVDHGIITYEALCMLVAHFPDSRNLMTVNHNVAVMASGRIDEIFVDYVAKAREDFTEQLPRATEVIEEASERYLGSMARYAVDGAALARQFELDSAA
jgi:hypothetical protein